ncbi:BA14K family protein [uncultured Aureimonas sp.]|uniref:BA14K family protein n=1 Tax=uncultured Aureimonas sp. TaxID=1604662 RepID=UPI0025DFDA54|nr:BA14K family protein [uncultured Aureimonas sp.]
MVGWRPAVVAMLGAAACLASSVLPASAWEYVGLDPYNRPVYALSGPIPKVPLAVSPPVYQRKSGAFGGPQVAGPLYYARPAPPVPGLYRDDPALTAGSILAFDLDAALADAEAPRSVTVVRRGETPAPFTGPWYRYCETRYRSFDPESGTYQPSSGPRRLCR